MRILVAPTAYKESLRPAQAAEAIASGARRACAGAGADVEIDLCPISDGGTGFVDAMARATGAKERRSSVCGPLGVTVDAPWALLSPGGGREGDAVPIVEGLLDLLVDLLRTSSANSAARPDRPLEGRVAFIEIASCAGLALVPTSKRDPEKTTSYGLGELLRDAMDARCEVIVIGLGDSATCDGGAGAAAALGARFYRDATALRPAPHKVAGGELSALARVDLRGLDDRLKKTRIVVACDVSAPLLGAMGSARVFAPQKGASPEGVKRLEAGLDNFAAVCVEAGLRADAGEAGAGAAGGLGYGLSAFCVATLTPGIDLLMRTVRFDARVAGADLVLTGEGRLDAQSLKGKACVEVARRAQQAGKPAIALVGSVGEGVQEALAPRGPFESVEPIAPEATPRAEAIRRAPELLEAAAERVVRAHLARAPEGTRA